MGSYSPIDGTMARAGALRIFSMSTLRRVEPPQDQDPVGDEPNAVWQTCEIILTLAKCSFM